MSIRILIVEDEGLIRETLAARLGLESDITVIGTAESGLAALKFLQKETPDVILMDAIMPDMNGMEAARQILTQKPKIKIIAVSGHDEKQIVDNMLNAGAKGYVLKQVHINELLRAIREVMYGKTYLDAGITDLVVEDYLRLMKREQQEKSLDTLSCREREVLQMLVEGRSPREIAERLYIDRKTAEVHRRHIMEKLHMDNLADLVKFAIREGITSIEP